MTRASNDNLELDDGLAELRENRLRALGTRTPRCSWPGCPETDPLALTGACPDIVCAEHLADRQDRSWTEEHHYNGKANSPEKGPIPANDHAPLSAMQRRWPRETLRNPDGSPLLRAAAAIRGWLDILLLLIDRTMHWIPPALERLDELLCDQIGPRWWDTLGWQP